MACDSKGDAQSAARVELLARAVILVAGMAIPDAAREAVLARVVAIPGKPMLLQSEQSDVA